MTLLDVLKVFSLDRIIRWCGSRWWTLQFLMVAVGLIEEVFKVHAQERIQRRFLEQSTLKFQFRVVEVFARVSGPQDRVQRRTVQQIVDIAPLPTLDVPVPQMVEQLPDVLSFFRALSPDPEQVIEVPKILPEDVPFRSVLRDTQLAEQLVEVPTIISFSSLQRIVEQNVDIPVPGRGGRIAGLQGFLPGQSSTALPFEERISKRIVEQNVDFPVGGGLQDFLPGQSSSSSSHVPARVSEALDEPGEGFFRTFPQNKKSAKLLGSHSGSELLPESSPSSPAAHVDHWVDGDDVWIRIDSVHRPFWKRLLSDHVQWHPPWERH